MSDIPQPHEIFASNPEVYGGGLPVRFVHFEGHQEVVGSAGLLLKEPGQALSGSEAENIVFDSSPTQDLAVWTDRDQVYFIRRQESEAKLPRQRKGLLARFGVKVTGGQYRVYRFQETPNGLEPVMQSDGKPLIYESPATREVQRGLVDLLKTPIGQEVKGNLVHGHITKIVAETPSAVALGNDLRYQSFAIDPLLLAAAKVDALSERTSAV